MKVTAITVTIKAINGKLCISIANRLARILFCLLLLLSCSSSLFAATFVDENQDANAFDHLTTGFPLTGAHGLIDCEACHVGGVFDELPQQCDRCHDGVFAVGVNPSHIPITDSCEVCHTTFGFE
ncbi:hypothetical protein, partial [Kaarinaea lacus]